MVADLKEMIRREEIEPIELINRLEKHNALSRKHANDLIEDYIELRDEFFLHTPAAVAAEVVDYIQVYIRWNKASMIFKKNIDRIEESIKRFLERYVFDEEVRV